MYLYGKKQRLSYETNRQIRSIITIITGAVNDAKVANKGRRRDVLRRSKRSIVIEVLSVAARRNLIVRQRPKDPPWCTFWDRSGGGREEESERERGNTSGGETVDTLTQNGLALRAEGAMVGSAHKPSINQASTSPGGWTGLPPTRGLRTNTIEEQRRQHVHVHTDTHVTTAAFSHQTRSQTTLGPRRQSRVSRSVQSVCRRIP